MGEMRSEERQILCSSCFKVVPEALVHVIPLFNNGVGGYVTTFRCERCWLPALEESHERIVKADEWVEIASLATFFERHGVFLHEFRRGDPLPIVRQLLCQTIELVKSEVLKLSAGPIATSAEQEAPAPD